MITRIVGAGEMAQLIMGPAVETDHLSLIPHGGKRELIPTN